MVGLVLLLLVTLMGPLPGPPGRAAIPEPHNLYGKAFDPVGSFLPRNETLTAWIDGVDYSNATQVYTDSGDYDLDVSGNWYTNLSAPNTPERKEGADLNDSIMFVRGNLTTSGTVFQETVPWFTGSTDLLDLHEAPPSEQPALLKISCLVLRPSSGNQTLWLHNPTPAAVDLGGSYVKKDGIGATAYNAWQFPLGGMLGNNSSLEVDIGGFPLNATGDDVEIVWSNGGTAFGGQDIVVDRVEWNQTGGGGTHYWEASNTIATDAVLSYADNALWRLGFPGSPVDTNDNEADFLSGPACGQDYVPRGYIDITSNAGFIALNGVIGGSGSAADPYTIAGWELNGTGVSVRDTTAHFVLRNLYIHGYGLYGVTLRNVRNATLEDSVLEDNYVGAFLDDVRDSSVRGNRFSGSSWGELKVIGASANIDVTGNEVEGGSSFDISGSDVLVGGNRLIGAGSIVVTGSRTTVTGNAVISGGYYGIEVGSTADNVTVEGNTVAFAYGSGFYLRFTENLTARGNYVYGSGLYGIEAWGGVNNRLYHNYLIGNYRNAMGAPGSVPTWDDGYPSGGNYWSDYAGVDNCSGPLQDNCTGPDGIGDTAYVIGLGHVDRYPLVTPPDPDVFPPAAPSLSPVMLSGPGLADLTLQWPRTPDEGLPGGTVGYQVLRSLSFWGPYVPIANVTATGSPTYTYACPGCGHNVSDTSWAFYRVDSRDAAGNVAQSRIGAKYARSVSTGPHLLGVPLEPSTATPDLILQTLGYDMVRTFRNWDSSDPWKARRPGTTGDLDTLWVTEGEALWVNVTVPGVFTLAGLVDDSPAVFLRRGWSLVTYKSFVSQPQAQSLAGIGGVARVETFDASADPYRLRAVGAAEMLVPGEAYWVLVTGSGGNWRQW